MEILLPSAKNTYTSTLPWMQNTIKSWNAIMFNGEKKYNLALGKNPVK